MFRRLALIALMSAALPAAWSQAPEPAAPAAAPQGTTPGQVQAGSTPGTFTLKVQTQIVVLDVVVTDKQGNIVHNLNKEDFDIYEDDMTQKVRSFERPQTHVLPSNLQINGTAELDKVAPEAPVSIIVLDEMNTKFEDEYFARYSLKKYLDTLGETLTQPTMLVAVDLQKFMVLRDYTTKKQDILDAMSHHLARFPWHLGNGGGSWNSEMFNSAFNALIQVAQATQGHVGHKNMIWIGRGFPTINLDAMLPDDQEVMQAAIETCTNMLRDARVTMYTVDPGGIRSAPTSTDDSGFNNENPFGEVSFTTMAQATGGRAYFGRNDVDNLIGTSVRNGIEFYTLSYTPNNKAETEEKAFRKIRIIMKDKNLKAVSREGYFPSAPPPPPMMDGKPSSRLVFDLSMAAQSMMVYDGVPISLTRSKTDMNDFTIHVDEKAIEWQEHGTDPRTADISILVASFDRKGNLITRNAQNVTATAPALATGTPPTPHAVNIHTKLAVVAPIARMRVVVRLGSNGKVGAENMLFVDKSQLVDPTSVTPKRSKNRPANGGVDRNADPNRNRRL